MIRLGTPQYSLHASWTEERHLPPVVKKLDKWARGGGGDGGGGGGRGLFMLYFAYAHNQSQHVKQCIFLITCALSHMIYTVLHAHSVDHHNRFNNNWGSL